MTTTSTTPPAPATGSASAATASLRRRRVRTTAVWAVQIVLAAQFAAGGLIKLSGDPQMIAMFAEIGAGQWLRVLVGLLEVAAAVGLLIPRLARPAAAGLVALMAGAAVTNIVWLATSPVLPLVFLLLATVVVVLRRSPR